MREAHGLFKTSDKAIETTRDLGVQTKICRHWLIFWEEESDGCSCGISRLRGGSAGSRAERKSCWLFQQHRYPCGETSSLNWPPDCHQPSTWPRSLGSYLGHLLVVNELKRRQCLVSPAPVPRVNFKIQISFCSDKTTRIWHLKVCTGGCCSLTKLKKTASTGRCDYACVHKGLFNKLWFKSVSSPSCKLKNPEELLWFDISAYEMKIRHIACKISV